MNLIIIFCVYYRPANPGEEIVLHCGPMTDIATQIVEIFYPLSVAANIIIPGCDAVYNYNKIFNIMKEIQPTLIWGTSKLYEQIYHKLRNMHYSMSKIKKTILGLQSIHKLMLNILFHILLLRLVQQWCKL